MQTKKSVRKPIYKIRPWYEGQEELYQELSDDYDRQTVARCRRWLNDFNPRLPKIDGRKVFTEKNQAGWRKMLADVSMYFIVGEAYANKDKTIREIMKERQQRADRLETATPVRGVNCLICRAPIVEIDRTFMGDLDNEKVLFMYDCSSCKRRRAFWEDGEEYRPKSPKCQRCQIVLNEASEMKDYVLTITQTCPTCDNVTTEVHDYTPAPDPVLDENFEADRARFCLSREEGEKYLAGKHTLEQSTSSIVRALTEEEETKENQTKLQQIQKLTLDQVSKKLSVELGAHGYSQLIFGEAEIDKDIRVGFQIQEVTGRSEYDARTNLQKLVIKTLRGTNWKLITRGVNYRLGILSGRLRGFDREKDLIALAERL